MLFPSYLIWIRSWNEFEQTTYYEDNELREVEHLKGDYQCKSLHLWDRVMNKISCSLTHIIRSVTKMIVLCSYQIQD